MEDRFSVEEVEVMLESCEFCSMSEQEIIKWTEEGMLVPTYDGEYCYSFRDIVKLVVGFNLLIQGNQNRSFVKRLIVDEDFSGIDMLIDLKGGSIWDILMDKDKCNSCRYFFNVAFSNMHLHCVQYEIGFCSNIQEFTSAYNGFNDNDYILEYVTLFNVLDDIRALDLDRVLQDRRQQA